MFKSSKMTEPEVSPSSRSLGQTELPEKKQEKPEKEMKRHVDHVCLGRNLDSFGITVSPCLNWKDSLV